MEEPIRAAARAASHPACPPPTTIRSWRDIIVTFVTFVVESHSLRYQEPQPDVEGKDGERKYDQGEPQA
jgi:hypothetical protein